MTEPRVFDPRARKIETAMGRPLRVLHCPWNMAGNPAGLARAERSIGLDSRCLSLASSALEYPTDEVLTSHAASGIERERARFRLLREACGWADIVHFHAGQSILVPEPFPDFGGAQSPRQFLWRLYGRLLHVKDLPLLKALGKRIFVTFQGDDARQGEQQRGLAVSLAQEVQYSARADRWKRRRIAAFGRYADGIYALNPDILRVLPGNARFLPYANVDPAACDIVAGTGNTQPVIVHAPTDRAVKGTRFLLAAVAQLRAEGIAVELDIVENLPNVEARRRYARADFAVDQLLAGWYGGFGVECMVLGKPVLCYLRAEDETLVPQEMVRDLPVISAEPATLVDVLREWLTVRRRDWGATGRRGRLFVERWHDPIRIAQAVADDYRHICQPLEAGHYAGTAREPGN